MVKYATIQLNSTFKALSDPTRRAILHQLSEGEALVSDLAAPFDMSLPAITKHLNVLEAAGLLQRRKQGRERICCLIAEPLQHASGWIDSYQQFWQHRLDKLAEIVEPDSEVGI